MSSDLSAPPGGASYTTQEVARRLGLAVRSVQLMVDRGELRAWKTPGGHRRIDPASVQQWLAGRRPEAAPGPVRRVLLIEDSAHYQNLVSLLVRRHCPEVELRVAADGVSGLLLAGQWVPQVLLIDLLLPGMDGAALIAGLRGQPALSGTRLIVVTSLDASERGPYQHALDGLPVVHKPRLVLDLPALLGAEAGAAT